MLGIVAVALIVPLGLHLAVLSDHALLVATWWPALGLLALGLALARRARWPLFFGFLTCMVVLVWVWRTGTLLAAFMPSFAINLGLGAFFARTLRAGREPLITRLARVERAHSRLPFPEEMARYTRRLTQIWVAFFALNASVTLLLASTAPLAAWSFYANVLNVPLLAAMFAAEYVYRRRRFPAHPHVSPWALALRVAAHPGEYLGRQAK